jgi:hypothetical protein
MKTLHGILTVVVFVSSFDILLAAEPPAPGTSNFGLGNWELQVIGQPGITIRSVSTVNSDVCWLAGESGLIARTTNAGSSWAIVSPGSIGTAEVYVVEGVSDSIALVSTTVSDTTFIYRTTNAGHSWTQTFSQIGGHITGIIAVTSARVLALGDPVGDEWTFLVSTNSGMSWDSTTTRPQRHGNHASDFHVLGTSTVYFIDNVDQSYSSGDGGNSWFDFHISLGPGPWVSLYNTGHDVIMAGSSTVWHLSAFGGWTYAGPVPQPGIPPLCIAGATGTQEFWLIQDALYYSSNGGSTWTGDAPNGLDRQVTLVDIVTIASRVAGWSVGQSDTVYRYNRFPSEVPEDRTAIPHEFQLSQNYPNPFNPSTSVRITMRTSAFVSVKVYDVLGNEVATLKEGILPPGDHIATWDARDAPSGVYFFRLRVGDQMKTARGILIR